MEREFTGRVMVLPESPTEDEVADYLVWLGCSVFAYHIDDDVHEISWTGVPNGITSEELQQLMNNSIEMWEYDANFIWNCYPLPRELDEISQELFGVDYDQLGQSGKWDVEDKFKFKDL